MVRWIMDRMYRCNICGYKNSETNHSIRDHHEEPCSQCGKTTWHTVVEKQLTIHRTPFFLKSVTPVCNANDFTLYLENPHQLHGCGRIMERSDCAQKNCSKE